jgi:hypothetical protein
MELAGLEPATSWVRFKSAAARDPHHERVSGYSSSRNPSDTHAYPGVLGMGRPLSPKRRARPERVTGFRMLRRPAAESRSNGQSYGPRHVLHRQTVALSSSVDVNDYRREQGLSARTSRVRDGYHHSTRSLPCARSATCHNSVTPQPGSRARASRKHHAGAGDDRSDERPEHEQHAVRAAAHERGGIGRQKGVTAHRKPRPRPSQALASDCPHPPFAPPHGYRFPTRSR